MRILLIVGAAACFVIGVKWTCEGIAYYCPMSFPIAALAFVPIILIAPRSATSKKRALFVSLALTEAIVIVSDFVLVLR